MGSFEILARLCPDRAFTNDVCTRLGGRSSVYGRNAPGGLDYRVYAKLLFIIQSLARIAIRTDEEGEVESKDERGVCTSLWTEILRMLWLLVLILMLRIFNLLD